MSGLKLSDIVEVEGAFVDPSSTNHLISRMTVHADAGVSERACACACAGSINFTAPVLPYDERLCSLFVYVWLWPPWQATASTGAPPNVPAILRLGKTQVDEGRAQGAVVEEALRLLGQVGRRCLLLFCDFAAASVLLDLGVIVMSWFLTAVRMRWRLWCWY